MTMVVIEITGSGSSWRASAGGRLKRTGSTAAALLVAMARRYPVNTTIYAPAVMAQCMKAGDMTRRGDTNSGAAPAYNSTIS